VLNVVPEDRLYTKEHEWISIDGKKAKVGVTDHAEEQLGDIVYIELPKKGGNVKQMTPCGVIESVKAVSEIYAPVSGTVIEVNSTLNDHPEKVNQDPYGEGWMFVVEMSNPSEVSSLLKAPDYLGLVKA